MGLIDVYDLRHSLAAMVAGAMTSRDDRERLAADVLRILDAFEAMRENNWMIHRNNTETAEGEVVECWDIVASDGTCLAELGDPLSSLLAAVTSENAEEPMQ